MLLEFFDIYPDIAVGVCKQSLSVSINRCCKHQLIAHCSTPSKSVHHIHQVDWSQQSTTTF